MAGNREVRAALVQRQEFENGQRGGERKKSEPAIGHFPGAPKPGRGLRRLNGELAVNFQAENPAGVQADGEVEIARSVIRESEQDAGEREAEKTGHERVEIRKAAQHAGKQGQPGTPADGFGGSRALQKM